MDGGVRLVMTPWGYEPAEWWPEMDEKKPNELRGSVSFDGMVPVDELYARKAGLRLLGADIAALAAYLATQTAQIGDREWLFAIAKRWSEDG